MNVTLQVVVLARQFVVLVLQRFFSMGIEDATHGLVDLDYRSPRGNRMLALELLVADWRADLPRGGDRVAFLMGEQFANGGDERAPEEPMLERAG